MAKTVNFTIRQGETWRRIVRWEQGEFVYKPITGITKAAPAVLTVTGHGLVDGWRGAISNVVGMTEINAKNEPPLDPDEYYKLTVNDANTIEINALNTLGFKPYTSGGILRYRPPVDLDGFTARMSFRKKIKDSVSLFDLTTDNGRIALDNVEKTITLLIQDEDTAEFGFTSAVYDLELVSSGGEVSILLSGQISVVKNVTR